MHFYVTVTSTPQVHIHVDVTSDFQNCKCEISVHSLVQFWTVSAGFVAMH